MLPDWETIRGVWPLLVGIAALWARLEVALALARNQAKRNEIEIGKLELKAEKQGVAAQTQAVQLGRIEEALVGIGRTLERLDRKISGP